MKKFCTILAAAALVLGLNATPMHARTLKSSDLRKIDVEEMPVAKKASSTRESTTPTKPAAKKALQNRNLKEASNLQTHVLSQTPVAKKASPTQKASTEVSITPSTAWGGRFEKNIERVSPLKTTTIVKEPFGESIDSPSKISTKSVGPGSDYSYYAKQLEGIWNLKLYGYWGNDEEAQSYNGGEVEISVISGSTLALKGFIFDDVTLTATYNAANEILTISLDPCAVEVGDETRNLQLYQYSFDTGEKSNVKFSVDKESNSIIYVADGNDEEYFECAVFGMAEYTAQKFYGYFFAIGLFKSDSTVKTPSVQISPADASLTVGETLQYNATLTNATEISREWSVSNSDVAEITADGLLTAKAAGTAEVTVTVTLDNGQTISASTSLSVSEPKAPASAADLEGTWHLTAYGVIDYYEGAQNLDLGNVEISVIEGNKVALNGFFDEEFTFTADFDSQEQTLTVSFDPCVLKADDGQYSNYYLFEISDGYMTNAIFDVDLENHTMTYSAKVDSSQKYTSQIAIGYSSEEHIYPYVIFYEMNLTKNVNPGNTTYQISFVYDENMGCFAEDGTVVNYPIEVPEGSDFKFYVLPAEGYELAALYLDGNDITADVDEDWSYTIEDITASHVVEAVFEIREVCLEICGIEGGSVSLCFSYGYEPKIAIKPEEGWAFHSIDIDGQIITELNNGDSHIIDPLVDDSRLFVTFKADTPVVSVDTPDADDNIIVSSRNKTIRITGADDKHEARVYDDGGRLLYTGYSREITLDRTGVHIITIAGNSYKVVLK